MGKINVLILDATGNKEQEACLPDDAPVSRVLGETRSDDELAHGWPGWATYELQISS